MLGTMEHVREGRDGLVHLAMPNNVMASCCAFTGNVIDNPYTVRDEVLTCLWCVANDGRGVDALWFVASV